MNTLKFNRKEQPAGKSSSLLKRAMTHNRIILPFLVLLTCLVISYLNWNVANTSRENELRSYFEYRARDVNTRIVQRLIGYEQILRNVRSLFNASDNINRIQFRSFFNSLHLDKNYPGIQGVGFSLLIPSDQIKKHINSVRNEGFPNYKIWPEDNRETYTSIIYLEPFKDLNLRAFGYDMFSEPIRRKAMETARDSNETVTSGKVNLVQDTGKVVQAGFLIYLPIYRNGKPNTTLSERRTSIIGWVYSPFRMGDFMKGLFSEHAADLQVEIYDGKNISDETKMYDSKTQPTGMDQSSVIKKEINFNKHGWTVLVKSTPQLESRLGFDTARIILIVGFSLSFLLAIITWLLVNKRMNAIKANKERERAEENLINSEKRYRRLFESAKDGILILDAETGKIVDVNPFLIELLGFSKERFIEKAIWEIGFFKDVVANQNNFIELQQKNYIRYEDLPLETANGKKINVEFVSNVYLVDNQKVIQCNIRDITERKHTEVIVKKTNEELTKLNAEKDKFFSIIAHDLKSPFNGFLNLTELMADSTEKFSQAEFAEYSKSLNKAARILYKLLDNLLEWAQIQNGSIKFTPKDSDLFIIASQSIDTINQRAQQKRITIINEIGNNEKIYADEKMISSVLRNLISNAVKFTRTGGKIIVQSEQSNDTIKISVTDNGVGIPENDVKKLFKIEEKVSSKGTEGELSTGLGLLLCKEFIEMHSGKIWVESKENIGSTFYFTLPNVNKNTR